MPNKELASDQQSKKGALTIAIENNPCSLCRVMGYPTCKGHGGSAGGGGGSDSGETKSKDVECTSNQTASPVATAAIQGFDKAKTSWVSQLSSDGAIHYEAGLLSIESDRLRGKLTFRVNPGLSKDEIETSQQFLKAVKTEFDEFKNQLTEQGVATKGFTAVIKDNELAICIIPPNPKYYDAFIKRLESKHLLPIPNPEREEKKEMLKAFNPKPFSLSTRLEKK